MAKDMSLVCRDVSKTYHDGDNQIAVLDSVSFELARGDPVEACPRDELLR